MKTALPLCWLGALLISACTAAQPTAPEAAPHAAADAGADAPSSPRSLTRRANFSDIIATAETQSPSKAPQCLLAGPSTDGGWYIGARFASPLRPLPRPSSDLFTQVMREGASVLLLTQHGVLGSKGMKLVALSEIASQAGESAQVLLITPSGIFVRSTDEPSNEGPVPLDKLQGLMAENELRDTALYLTADAETPIQVIAHILQLAAQQGLHRVGFALALPEGTRLPEPPASTSSPFACQGEAEVEQEGSLDPGSIRASVQPLSEAAKNCFDMLPYEEQQHGTAHLRFIVGPDGLVQDACLEETPAGSSRTLEHCLVAQARQLRFPKPSPAGEVAFVAPFRFTPTPLPETLPLCPASRLQP